MIAHINCADFRARLSDLLDGDVDSEWRAKLEAHLAVCQVCTIIWDSTKKTLRILADANTFELSPAELRSGTAAVMARIRSLRSAE